MPRRQVQVGEGGRTLGNLRPAGHVDIGGFRHEARSTGDFIAAGTPVIVERVGSESGVVEPSHRP